ncbi:MULTISPECIES: ABC transporter ATP-binding protein [unclassified Facklamia]|uniref:ABC transporter ATP-binding protein n=1 Tax=Aerococcaceae TaxID=186827 RepID=UPI0013BA00D9|nr:MULTISPECIES: ABC transporter ATP-binding protein [unclassified Facklamia]MBS4461186.1 ABC transporter ATP-binding protein [Aerococcaceae bacterium zg-B36]NEW64319.1 ATP-binding cassette domain-containing protein [Facklamia sp. 252]NEW67844.1 ATP-binding cassette domain-containing protein [Facklamia sp. 253]QQD64784.1 ABC transporter ATP-binding protein [Aerococcaceae bacterium zg-252]
MSSQPVTKSEWAEKMPIKEQVEVTTKITRYTLPFKWLFIVSMLFSAVSSFITVIMPRIIQTYIDQYLGNASATIQIALLFAGIYLVLILLQAVSNYFSNYLFRMASEKTVESIRNQIYTKVNGLGMRYFDQTPAGSIVSRITNDTETLKDFWNVFFSLFEGIVTSVSVFIGMYVLNAKMALLFLIFIPIMFGIIWYYQLYSSRVYRTMRENLSKLNTKLNENITGMSVVQHFRQEERMIAEFDVDNEEQYRGRRTMIHMHALMLNPFINLLENISLALVFYVLGNQFFDGLLEVGMVYAFTQYSTTFFRPMGMMMESLSQLQDGVVSSSRILRVMNHQEIIPEQDVDDQAMISDAKVEFKNVSFSYDGKHDVLKDISFTVNPGETVALVGHTGSGKSSIINVLMRFYEYHSGDVLIDGHSLRHFSYDRLREQIGLVLQDSFLFYGDVARNIRLLDQSISDRQVKEAARFVNADTFIESQPQGYQKKVIERGASYSSGQRQLISFARTMARNPKLLILDEATANIDTETEMHIQNSLQKMRKGRTTIAIAHRLSTIKDANLILVLDKGRIIERGTHDELIALGGTYYQMYQLQSMGHVD